MIDYIFCQFYYFYSNELILRIFLEIRFGITNFKTSGQFLKIFQNYLRVETIVTKYR